MAAVPVFGGLISFFYSKCWSAASRMAGRNLILIACSAAGIAACFAAFLSSQQPNDPSLRFETPRFNFGQAAEDSVLTHEFVFTNVASEAVRIVDVVSNCGCVVNNWPKEPVAPAESGVVSATLRLEGYRPPRSVSKEVLVQFVSLDNPSATQSAKLRLTASMVPYVHVDPTPIVMGHDASFHATIRRGILGRKDFARLRADASLPYHLELELISEDVLSLSAKPLEVATSFAPTPMILSLQYAGLDGGRILKVPVDPAPQALRAFPSQYFLRRGESAQEVDSLEDTVRRFRITGSSGSSVKIRDVQLIGVDGYVEFQRVESDSFELKVIKEPTEWVKKGLARISATVEHSSRRVHLDLPVILLWR